MESVTAVVEGTVTLVSTFVPGHPKTKGSLTAVTGQHLRDKPSSEKWRVLIVNRVRTDMAIREIGAGTGFASMYPAQGRIGVQIISYLQASVGPEPGRLARAWKWILSKLSGDVDKLARNVLDALSACDEGCGKGCKKHAGLIGDDSQVWDLYTHKRLAQPGMIPGQQINVWMIGDGEPW